jgi:3,4-dihydroxy 2-butanone 4-phosphate synthase/GTP cyclohydrolase II
VHVHVECLTGDVFGSTACRCGAELDGALATMAAGGGGVIVYLRPPGAMRACGLVGRDGGAAAPALGTETVAWILRDLGMSTVRLSDDAPAFGLVLFGEILNTAWHAQRQPMPYAAAV